MPAQGGPWQRLTASAGDERWPTLNPTSPLLAYGARRERNWDIYVLELRSGTESRLTDDPHFDGWPAWRPDGQALVFASAREGDLDLFLLELESGEERNLTADSAAHDFEPRWESNEQLLFVSTRDDSHDIFRLTVATGEVEALHTSPQRSERQPLALPEGQGLLVVAREARRSELAWLTPPGQAPLSWVGGVTDAALAPDGQAVAWLEQRAAGALLFRRALKGGEVQRLNGPTSQLSDLSWGWVEAGLMADRLQPLERPPIPTPRASGTSRLVRVDVRTESPRLNERALPAYQRMRAQVATELEQDFLGEVSELLRPIHFSSEESDYLSWHKSGRAVDVLLDLGWRQGIHLMDVVREDWYGDLYWRYWIRCPKQDGSCGEPLVEQPWDLTQYARWEVAPGEGGRPGHFVGGYYVDFTRIAEDAGWERISSYELPEFDWRVNLVALEYWHYQYTEGLNWYEAMGEVYTEDEMRENFNWALLRERAIPRWLLRAKGIPLPPELRQAPVELVLP